MYSVVVSKKIEWQVENNKKSDKKREKKDRNMRHKKVITDKMVEQKT